MELRNISGKNNYDIVYGNMMENIKENILNMIAENDENPEYDLMSEYWEGYMDGYHNALVCLMDKLGIQHNEKIH